MNPNFYLACITRGIWMLLAVYKGVFKQSILKLFARKSDFTVIFQIWSQLEYHPCMFVWLSCLLAMHYKFFSMMQSNPPIKINLKDEKTRQKMLRSFFEVKRLAYPFEYKYIRNSTQGNILRKIIFNKYCLPFFFNYFNRFL